VKKKKLQQSDVVNTDNTEDVQDDPNESDPPDVPNSAVHKLTDKTYDDFMKKHDNVVLLIYYPGHPKYKKFRDTWEALAKEHENKGVAYARLNAVAYKSFVEKLKPAGMPVLTTVRKGEMTRKHAFQGEFSLKDVTYFLQSQFGPGYVELSSMQDVSDFVHDDNYTPTRIVGVYRKGIDDSEFEEFKRLAFDRRDAHSYGVVQVKDDKAAAPFKAYFAEHEMKLPSFFVHRHEDKEQVQYTGSLLDRGNFDRFMSFNELPLLGEISNDKMGPWVSKRVPLVITFIDEDKDNGPLFMELKEVARDFVGKALFMYGDGKRWRHHRERLGLTSDVLPSLSVDTVGGKKMYPMDGEVTGENVRNHIQALVDGTLKDVLTSEDVPEQKADAPYKLVGRTLFPNLAQTEKHMFIMFWVEWCPHCKKLIPVWKELARKAKKIYPDVVVAEFNVSKNQLPGHVSMSSFPTCLFYRKDVKDEEPSKYKLESKVPKLLEWIKLAREGKTADAESSAKAKSTKGAAAPKKNDGPVKVVVKSTWKDIVMDPKTDVLVEFYAPWCGHCKALAPEYEELANRMRKTRRLVIANYDADANGMPDGVTIKGYPTVMLYTQTGKDKPIEFEGERTSSAMFEFVNKHRVGGGGGAKDEL
jgi:protein disulfide-isomerase-like protein